MAQWKKLLVSGSNISQLANDSGYLTAESAFNGFVTASINGTALIADSTTDTLNFATGSSGAGLTIVGTAGTDTITFDLSSIPNSTLANSTISGKELGTNLDSLTDGNGIADFTYNGSGTAVVTVEAADNTISVASGGISVVEANLTGIPTTALASNSITLSGDTGDDQTITLGNTLEVAGGTNINTVGTDTDEITINLDNNISVATVQTSGDVTIAGNLTVEGDTLNANVTNLDIEDRFILLNSGSAATGDSGIVFGGSNGTAQSGAGLIWDASYKSNEGRLAVVNNMASNATGNQTPSLHVAGVFEGTTANAITAQADHVGNIRVESNEIYIYV